MALLIICIWPNGESKTRYNLRFCHSFRWLFYAVIFSLSLQLPLLHSLENLDHMIESEIDRHNSTRYREIKLNKDTKKQSKMKKSFRRRRKVAVVFNTFRIERDTPKYPFGFHSYLHKWCVDSIDNGNHPNDEDGWRTNVIWSK